MKQLWSIEELEEFWKLHPIEISLIKNKTKTNQLGFALILKYFQVTSYFPKCITDISESVIFYVAKQLDIVVKSTRRFNWNQKTAEAYRRQIREYLGFRESQESDISEVINWLIEHVLPEGNMSIPHLQEKAYNFLKSKKIEPFSRAKMDRYIRSALNIFEINMFNRIFEALSDKNKESLLSLIIPQEEQILDSCYLRDLKKIQGMQI